MTQSMIDYKENCQKPQISDSKTFFKKRLRKKFDDESKTFTSFCLVTDFDQLCRYHLSNPSRPPSCDLCPSLYQLLFHNTATEVAFFHLPGAKLNSSFLDWAVPSHYEVNQQTHPKMLWSLEMSGSDSDLLTGLDQLWPR